MRAVLAGITVLAVGCSFIGARVPDKPPAPQDCPHGVIAADAVGAGLFLAYPAAITIDGIRNDWDGYQGLALVVAGIPSAIIGAVYLSSMLYGLNRRGRCLRLKDQQRDELVIAERAAAQPPERPPQLGDAPMHCALEQPDVGACYGDAGTCQTEADRTGSTCETRTSTWCFDARDKVGGSRTICSVSRSDCDARRLPFTSDRTLTVTTCGSYTVSSAL